MVPVGDNFIRAADPHEYRLEQALMDGVFVVADLFTGENSRRDAAWMSTAKSCGRIPPHDHRKLLAKYIQHVGACEGADYLRDSDRSLGVGMHGPSFTDSEWAELQRLAGEAGR